MIRLLSVYRYCTMGGVENGLRVRMETLAEHGIHADACFLRDYGGYGLFEHLSDRAFLAPDEARFARLMSRRDYDAVTIIDTFEVLDWLRRGAHAAKVIVELRSTYEHTLARLKEMAGHRVDAFLVPSEFQKSFVADYLPREMRSVPRHVAYNFVDIDAFRPRDVSEPVNGHSKKIVCWIGRIDPLKNWSGFLDLAEQLCERDDIVFWMIGGGGSEAHERKAFRKQLEKMRVASRLHWWPAMPPGKMPAALNVVAATGGAVVLTSKNESFGFAAVETMACGCPLVAADVGAMPEVVRDGETGLLYRLGSVESAMTCVQRVLDDKALRERMASAGPAHVRERFSPERGARAYAEVIHRVLGRAMTPVAKDEAVRRSESSAA